MQRFFVISAFLVWPIFAQDLLDPSQVTVGPPVNAGARGYYNSSNDENENLARAEIAGMVAEGWEKKPNRIWNFFNEYISQTSDDRTRFYARQTLTQIATRFSDTVAVVQLVKNPQVKADFNKKLKFLTAAYSWNFLHHPNGRVFTAAELKVLAENGLFLANYPADIYRMLVGMGNSPKVWNPEDIAALKISAGVE